MADIKRLLVGVTTETLHGPLPLKTSMQIATAGLELLAHVTAQSAEIARLKADLEHGEECEECDRPINEGKGTFTICGRCWNAAQEKHVAEVARLKGEVDRLRDSLKELATSPVEFEDERINYVSMQVDRQALEEARELFTAEGIETK